MITIKMVF